MLSRNIYSFGLLDDTIKYSDKVKRHERNNLEILNLNDITVVDFPENQYFRQQTPKNQIVLHHTVSGRGVDGDINWWLKTSQRIATALIIDWKGKIYQCFSSKYWGHHLGVKTINNLELNKKSIGIEIDSWGGLIKHDKKWYPAKYSIIQKKNIANLDVGEIKNVQEYPNGFRGFYGFEKYTDEQIESVRKLLLYWNRIYDIPLKYNDKMWDVSDEALNGKKGIWTHVSYRKDKSDCHPQPELISMLNSL